MIKTTALSALVLTGLMAAGVAQAADTHKVGATAAVTTHAASAAVAASAAAVTPKDKAPAVKVEAGATGLTNHGDDKSIPTTPKIGPRGKDGAALKADVKADVKAAAKHN